MAVINIPHNFGPTAGEQFVSYSVRSFQFSDGSIVMGSGLIDSNGVAFDCETHNLAMSMIANDEEDVEATPDVDGVVNIGITAGYT